MQNVMELDMKKKLDTKALTLGVLSLKSSLEQFWSERTYQAACLEP